MADLKISQLTSATTPLAGTEVAPLVQGSITKQVSIANLTAGRDVSASGLFIDANSATNAVRITQTGAGNALLVEDSTNPDATPFVIDASGKVLMGLSSSVAAAGLQIWGVDNFAQQHIRRFSDNTTGPSFNLFKARGNATTASVVQSGDSLGATIFSGQDGLSTSPTSTLPGARIEAFVDGTPGVNDMPGRLVFSTTADGAAAVTERMRIDSAGNVGIGATANASAILDAQSTTKGVRMPNMTTAQKNAIATPAAGLMVFDTSLAKLCVYSGATWETITSI